MCSLPQFRGYCIDVSSMSEYTDEEEVLLCPNFGFTVKQVTEGANQSTYQNVDSIIDMEVSYMCLAN